ncbi:uncharacterized protein LOC133176101 [Saccostrea echinata]|uniref:uncharacterized protein LOC133176101 n=1 Tax=Saccostrea echinata TaxID=191078 RepID=UPI002A7EF0CA|nr:uncharacterized protein LOC133176101 [Saccostrea echinata]
MGEQRSPRKQSQELFGLLSLFSRTVPQRSVSSPTLWESSVSDWFLGQLGYCSLGLLGILSGTAGTALGLLWDRPWTALGLLWDRCGTALPIPKQSQKAVPGTALGLLSVRAGSQGVRSTSKEEEGNQKTRDSLRRCSSRKTIHRLDGNSNEKQSDSSESKESQKSDESYLKEDQALAVSKTEESVNVKDTDSMTIPKEDKSPMITDGTDLTPIHQDTETMDRTDEICWDFEKERCKEVPELSLWGTRCDSDAICEEPEPYQNGKCCEIPCDNFHKVCRYPTDDFRNSFITEYYWSK